MRKQYLIILCGAFFTLLVVCCTGCPKKFYAYYKHTITYDKNSIVQSQSKVIPCIIQGALSHKSTQGFRWRPDRIQFGEWHDPTPTIYWDPQRSEIKVWGKQGKTERIRKIIAIIKSNMREQNIEFKESWEFVRKPILEI